MVALSGLGVAAADEGGEPCEVNSEEIVRCDGDSDPTKWNVDVTLSGEEVVIPGLDSGPIPVPVPGACVPVVSTASWCVGVTLYPGVEGDGRLFYRVVTFDWTPAPYGVRVCLLKATCPEPVDADVDGDPQPHGYIVNDPAACLSLPNNAICVPAITNF